MEEALLKAKAFDQIESIEDTLQTDNHYLAKTYTLISHLRGIAHKFMAQNPSNDISEYYIALIYYSLNEIRTLSLSTLQRQHALLSASLLADRLGL